MFIRAPARQFTNLYEGLGKFVRSKIYLKAKYDGYRGRLCKNKAEQVLYMDGVNTVSGTCHPVTLIHNWDATDITFIDGHFYMTEPIECLLLLNNTETSRRLVVNKTSNNETPSREYVVGVQRPVADLNTNRQIDIDDVKYRNGCMYIDYMDPVTYTTVDKRLEKLLANVGDRPDLKENTVYEIAIVGGKPLVLRERRDRQSTSTVEQLKTMVAETRLLQTMIAVTAGHFQDVREREHTGGFLPAHPYHLNLKETFIQVWPNRTLLVRSNRTLTTWLDTPGQWLPTEHIRAPRPGTFPLRPNWTLYNQIIQAKAFLEVGGLNGANSYDKNDIYYSDEEVEEPSTSTAAAAAAVLAKPQAVVTKPQAVVTKPQAVVTKPQAVVVTPTEEGEYDPYVEYVPLYTIK
ncbi:hypothetical protein J6590_036350 [Homalodisca vitripennis]|nr:hypothetical protein J6590_036350 [Homalodisca vitripennis]